MKEEKEKPILEEKYVKVPLTYLNILREQNERLMKEFNEEQKNHELEVKRFEKIINRMILMNGIILGIWFIGYWIISIFG